MGWKTITGGIVALLGWVFNQPEITPEVVIQAAGGVLTVIGARHAVAKSTKKL